jgi:flagellar basal-body rod protein FlgC
LLAVPCVNWRLNHLAGEFIMSNTSTIALSGLAAAARRLDVSAGNIANVMTSGALPDKDGTVPSGAPRAYDPLELVQSENANGGTQTRVRTITPSYVAVSDPSAPFANEEGLVAAPNVDLSKELIDLVVARYSFAANARVLKADDQMTQTLIDTMA